MMNVDVFYFEKQTFPEKVYWPILKKVFSYTFDGISYAEVMFLYAIRKKTSLGKENRKNLS